MSYATPVDLIASVPEHLVADLTGTEEPDETAISGALAKASAEIDGYLASRYALPLPAVPEVLKHYAIDIALYRLQNLRALGDLEDSRKRYEDAVAYLKLLATGKVSLGLPSDGSAGSPPAASGIAYTARPSIMQGNGY